MRVATSRNESWIIELKKLLDEGIIRQVFLEPIISQLILTGIERLFHELEELRVATVVIRL